MAELKNWLGDLWEEAGTEDERVYDWADDESLESAFARSGTALPDDLAGALTEALTSAPARKAPSAMAELSATARRPERTVDAAEPDDGPPPAPAPVPAAAEPALPAVLMGSGRTRVEDDILPTRRPPGGRFIALRMSLRTR